MEWRDHRWATLGQGSRSARGRRQRLLHRARDAATDNGGGFTSDPVGLAGPPASIEAAQTATGGMLEVSGLPTINWDPAYRGAIVAHPSGDIDPSPAQLANSDQAHCILYVQNTNTRRRSGDVNRTSFMYALDRLGYRGHYDVYDHTGMGNTNNQLGGRATVAQAQGYNLIVYDNGRARRSSMLACGASGSLPTVSSALGGTRSCGMAGWTAAARRQRVFMFSVSCKGRDLNRGNSS